MRNNKNISDVTTCKRRIPLLDSQKAEQLPLILSVILVTRSGRKSGLKSTKR